MVFRFFKIILFLLNIDKNKGRGVSFFKNLFKKEHSLLEFFKTSRTPCQFWNNIKDPVPKIFIPCASIIKMKCKFFFFQFQWNSILWGNAISLKCWVHAGGQTFWTEKLKLKLKEKEKEKILLIKIEIDDAKEFCDSDVFLKKLIYQRYFNW